MSPFFLLASISSLKAELERIKVEKGQVSFTSFKLILSAASRYLLSPTVLDSRYKV